MAPEMWQRLVALDVGAGFVVLNVASGPGAAVDAGYPAVVRALLGRGRRVCGYVDTNYARRACDVVLSEALRYRTWYGVEAVFLDRVDSSADEVPYHRDLVDGLRAAGATTIVLNPGVLPARETAVLGDIVVTFEGPWEEHRRLATPPWVHDTLSVTSVCHLVYSVPRRVSLPRVVARAAEAGAGIVGVSSGGMPNPWSTVGPWGV